MIEIKHFDTDKGLTYGESLGPAMEIDNQEDADIYFEAMIKHLERVAPEISREELIGNSKGNLGYYAGYYSDETRARVERLFCCSHPIFGKASNGTPTAEEAFEMGRKMGEAAKEQSNAG